MENKGIKPDLIIINELPRKVFKEYSEQVGNKTYFWYNQKDPPFKHLALPELGPFFIVCNFEKGFGITQYCHSDWEGDKIKIEINEIDFDKVKSSQVRDDFPVYSNYEKPVDINELDKTFGDLLIHINNEIDRMASFYLKKDEVTETEKLKLSQNLEIISSVFMKMEVKNSDAVILGKLNKVL